MINSNEWNEWNAHIHHINLQEKWTKKFFEESTAQHVSLMITLSPAHWIQFNSLDVSNMLIDNVLYCG